MGDERDRQRTRMNREIVPTARGRDEELDRALLAQLQRLRAPTPQPPLPPVQIADRATEGQRATTAETTPIAGRRARRPTRSQQPASAVSLASQRSDSQAATSGGELPVQPPSYFDSRIEQLRQQINVQKSQARLGAPRSEARATPSNQDEESSRLSGQRSMLGGLTRSGIAQERRRLIEARETELREALGQAQAAVLTQRMRGLAGIPVPRAPSLQFWGGFGDAVGAEYILGLVEMLVPLIPFAGDLIDAIEATSGRSWLLQERLSVADRAMAGGGVALTLIPLAGRIVRAGRTETEITARIARRLGRTDETLSEVLRRLARTHSAPHVVEEALRRALAHEPLTGAHIQALEEFIHALEPLATTRRLSRPSIRALARGMHRGWEIIEGVRRFNTTALFSKLERLWSRGRHSVYLTRANQLVGTHESLLAFRRAHPEYAGWHSHHVIEEVHLSNLGVRNNFPGRGELPCVLLPPRQHSQRLRSMLGQLDSLQPSSARELYMDYGRVYRLLLDDYSGGTGTAQELVDIVADMLEIDLVHR